MTFSLHNFVVMSFNDDEIILRGERHGGEVRLVKCDRTWQEYIDATNELKNAITNTSISSYYVIADTDTLYFTNLRTGVTRYTENLTNYVKLDYLSNCFTPQGFRFEHQDSIGIHAFHEFMLAEDKSCLVNEDGTVKVVACWDNYIVNHTAYWQMDESMFSTEQKSLFTQLEEAAKTFNSAWSLAGVGLGKSTGSNAVVGFVLSFYTNAAKTKTNTAGVALSMSKPAYGQIVIDYNKDCKVDKNMESLVKKSPEMENLARAFAATLNGTYEITPNDYFLPTGGLFTAIGGGTTFKLN